MQPAMLLGTAGDHIEVVIGVLLGVLIVLWALTAFTHWIRSAPWKQGELSSKDEQTIGRTADDGHQENDVSHDLPRFAVEGIPPQA